MGKSGKGGDVGDACGGAFGELIHVIGVVGQDNVLVLVVGERLGWMLGLMRLHELIGVAVVDIGGWGMCRAIGSLGRSDAVVGIHGGEESVEGLF